MNRFEQRACMIFIQMVNICDGINPYIYSQSEMTPELIDLKNRVKYLFSELQSQKEVMK